MQIHPTHGSVMLISAAACWGIGTVITKVALAGFEPLTLLTVQLAASIAILLILAGLLQARLAYTPGLGRLAALGVLNPGLAYTLALLGLTHVTASLSVLVWALEPALIFVLARLFLSERTTRRSQVALAFALSGVILVVYQPGARGDALGIALVLSAVATCAAYTVTTRRMLADDDSLTVVLVQQATALGLAVAVLTLVHVADGYALRLDGGRQAWIAAIASGGIYYGLAFWLYVGGLRHATASIAGSYLALIPVFGLAAACIYGDRLTSAQWVGAVLVIAGVAGVVVADLDRRRVPSVPVGKHAVPQGLSARSGPRRS